MNSQMNNTADNSFNVQPLLNFLTQQYDAQEVVNTLDQALANQVELMGIDENANTKQIAAGYQLLWGMKQAIAAGCIKKD